MTAQVEEYEFRYYSASGDYRFSISSYYNIEFWVAEKEVGSLVIDLPESYGDEIEPFLEEDGIFEIYRETSQGKRLLFGKRFFLALWRPKTDESGLKFMRLRCLGCNNIIDRRIVYYTTGSDETIIDDLPADDAVKKIMRENFGSDAEEYRDVSDYLLIEGNLGLAPNIDYDGFEYQKVLPLLRSLCDASYSENGVYLTFDVKWIPESKKYIFSTYVDQLGVNKGIFGKDTLYLTTSDGDQEVDSGGLSYASVAVDGSDRRTAVYAGGQLVTYSEGTDEEYEERIIKEAYDQDKIDKTPFGLWEDWQDARESADEDVIQKIADARLEEWKTKIVVNGHMSDAFTRFFGIEFDWGDIVAFKYKKYAYDVHISRVLFSLTGDGKKEIRIKTRNMKEEYY